MKDYNAIERDIIEALKKHDTNAIEALTVLAKITGNTLLYIQKNDPEKAKSMLHYAFDRAVDDAINQMTHPQKEREKPSMN